MQFSRVNNLGNKKKTDAGAFLGTVLFSSPQQHHIQKNTVFPFLFAFFSSSSHFVTVKKNLFVCLVAYCEFSWMRRKNDWGVLVAP